MKTKKQLAEEASAYIEINLRSENSELEDDTANYGNTEVRLNVYSPPEDATWERDLQNNFYAGLEMGVSYAYDELTTKPESLKELKAELADIQNQIKEFEKREKLEIEKKIMNLIGERNSLGRNIYTQNEIGSIVGVSASTVGKVVKRNSKGLE